MAREMVNCASPPAAPSGIPHENIDKAAGTDKGLVCSEILFPHDCSTNMVAKIAKDPNVIGLIQDSDSQQRGDPAP